MTIKQHQLNIKRAVENLNQVVLKHTGVRWPRIYNRWLENSDYYSRGYKDMTMVNEYLTFIFGNSRSWYNMEYRCCFRPALPEVNEFNIWADIDKELYEKGRDSAWQILNVRQERDVRHRAKQATKTKT